jgi:Zn finger protein HypA/HybF involved in hydrogenase expression
VARKCYCWDCEEVNDGDEDGNCTKCGSDNVISFDDEDLKATDETIMTIHGRGGEA